MDLLVDSNLAHMFGPEGAAIYFARLLKVDVRSLRPAMSQEWPHAFFIPSPTPTTAPQNAQAPPAPTTIYINRRPVQLLDYTIRQVGTVVPQGIWPPGNTSDSPARSASTKASLNMPIFFVGMDRISLGLSLPVAIAEGDRVPLQGAGSPAQIGHGSTAYIRITVSISPSQKGLSRARVPSFFLLKMCLSFSLVAWLQRVDYADNDQGPNPSAQHDIPREIRKAPRKRSGQVHGRKPLPLLSGNTNIEAKPFLIIGGPSTSL